MSEAQICSKCWTPNHFGITCQEALRRWYWLHLDQIVVHRAGDPKRPSAGREGRI